jgi:hypothetical protein
MNAVDREELLKRTAEGWSSLLESVAPAGDEGLSRTSSNGWTGVEQLAHVAAWHRIALAKATGRPLGEPFGWAEGTYESLELDDLNERLRTEVAGGALADVRVEFEDSYNELTAAVEGMSDTDLAQPWLPGHPDRGTLSEMLASNTFEHYEEHIPLVRALAAE